jgi:predicted small metal-binding protein
MSGESDAPRRGVVSSFLSLKCSDIGYLDCSNVTYGATEEALLRNLQYHVTRTHGITEESWAEKLSENLENYRKLITPSFGRD